MSHDSLFQSTVKVITRSFGLSNDPAVAGQSYAVDSLATSDAKILLLERSRFVTTGNATFLVGQAAANWRGTVFPIAQDEDMNPNTQEVPETWINTQDIIAILEES